MDPILIYHCVVPREQTASVSHVDFAAKNLFEPQMHPGEVEEARMDGVRR